MSAVMQVDPDLAIASKRAADIINEIRPTLEWAQLKRSWIAIRLADGDYDGTVYDSRRDAIKHQKNEFLCAYFNFLGAAYGGISAWDIGKWLQFHREAYRRGFRLPDPDDVKRDGGYQNIMTQAQSDRLDNVLARATAFRWSNE